MASFLIDRHSPIRSGIAPKLRHRSRHSESESNENPSLSLSHDDLSSSNIRYSPNAGNTGTSDTQDDSDKQTTKSKSMLSYFMTELTRDYKLEGDASEFVERRDRVYTSVNTPKNLEKFCAFGFLQCLDSILYMVTFLPLRILVAIVRVLTYPCAVIFMGSRHVLDGAQIIDLLKGVILIVSCFITSYMDMSMIYHIVRGQSIIKFYVFYNMLDVMDKLISGFGQDVLDSLYWTAVEPRGKKREHFGTLFHLIFAIVYVVMILIQAIILNVAFNSHNKNLLTIMMSNNFVEIKGNLFKRLDKNNLCQITYSDVKERFHYLVLLLFVFIRNMTELQWSWDMAFPIIQDAAIVMVVEVIVDWIKHAFITKFNELSASSYGDFALGLAQDIATSQKKHAFTNFSDQVCRRMGFTPIPLICLLFMVCSKSFNINGPLPWLLVFLFYMCLMSTKVLISIILLGWAQRLINERDKTTKSTATVVNSQVIPKKEDKGAPAKAKETLPELTVPLIITTSRSTTVSPSVAVNTDSAMSVDANISTSPQMMEMMTASTTYNGKHGDSPPGYMTVISARRDCSTLIGEWENGHANDEKIALQKEPISDQPILSSTLSSLSDSSSKSKLADPRMTCDVPGDVSDTIKMDFEVDFLTPEHLSASVTSPNSFYSSHSLSPSMVAQNSPSRQQRDSPAHDIDDFFQSVGAPELVTGSVLSQSSETPLLTPKGPKTVGEKTETCEAESEDIIHSLQELKKENSASASSELDCTEQMHQQYNINSREDLSTHTSSASDTHSQSRPLTNAEHTND